jgi:hypothetical protein
MFIFQVSSLFKAHKLAKQIQPPEITPSTGTASSSTTELKLAVATSSGVVTSTNSSTGTLTDKSTGQPKLVSEAPVTKCSLNNNAGKSQNIPKVPSLTTEKQNPTGPTTSSTSSTGQTE